MKKIVMTIMIAMLSVPLFVQFVKGDSGHPDDEHRDDDRWELSRVFERTPDVAPVTNAVYKEECSGCHMAYPPGLLPSRSWGKLMGQLDDHFGDNAELDAETAAKLERYLVEHSAETSAYRRSNKITRSLAHEQIPLRITEIPYIRHEHDEVPDRLITGNAEVGSLSRCESCHRRAVQGSFSENDIRIPGFGKWDD